MGIANRMMNVLEYQERGRQEAFEKMTTAQHQGTAVMASMVQLIQNTQEMSMRRLRQTDREAHRLLDADRAREKQKRRRQRAQEARDAPQAGAAEQVGAAPSPKAMAAAPISLHPAVADVGTSALAKRCKSPSKSLEAGAKTAKAPPLLQQRISPSTTAPPAMSPPRTPPPPMAVAAGSRNADAESQGYRKGHTDHPNKQNAETDEGWARRPRDCSSHRNPPRDVQQESKCGPAVTLRPGPAASGSNKRDPRKDEEHPASSSSGGRMSDQRPNSWGAARMQTVRKYQEAHQKQFPTPREAKYNDRYIQKSRRGTGLRNSGLLDDVIRRDRLIQSIIHNI